jgi:gluconate 2-dehydrogenase gamma chain
MNEGGSDRPDEVDALGTPLAGKRLSRLKLLKLGAAGAAGVAAGGVLGGEAEAKEKPAQPPPPLKFLTKPEFALVTAMAETIWPTDELGPGARVAGVGYYIDGQLASGWGMGQRWYMQGPFVQPQDSGHGWQTPMVPRDIYRASLPAFDAYAVSKYGKPYVELPATTQAQALDDLRLGRVPVSLSGATTFAGSDFYAMFRQNVLEGMLSDPSYGGNRDMVGWKWVGFPGSPMRGGGQYAKWIFNDKPYPFQYKPLAMPQDMGGM